MANETKKNAVQNLRSLVAPHLRQPKEGEEKRPLRLYDFVRGWLLVSEKKIDLGERAKFIRANIWDMAFHFYRTLDEGKEKEGWAIMFAIKAQYGSKTDDAVSEGYKEMKRRASEGDNMARKLLDYAQVSGERIIWVRWSVSANRVRVEHYHEAAERHLRAIIHCRNEEMANSYRSYRESMVKHGFLKAEDAKRITDDARATKAANDKAKAAAKKPVAAPKKRNDKVVEGGLAGLGAAVAAKKK